MPGITTTGLIFSFKYTAREPMEAIDQSKFRQSKILESWHTLVLQPKMQTIINFKTNKTINTLSF